MAVNPMKLMKLKDRYKVFKESHPKIMPFFSACKDMVKAGTVVEIKFTTPEGESKSANLKIGDEDIKTYELIRELRK